MSIEMTHMLVGEETYEVVDEKARNQIEEMGDNFAIKSEIPTKTSQLTNDSGFVTAAVATLLNYYLKSETYKKSETYSATEVDNLVNGLSARLDAFFDTDDATLDQLSEIVSYITSNKSLIDSITTSKVNVTDIINNLTTSVANKPLSAAQGVVLKGLIDTLSESLSNYQPKGNYALTSEIPKNVSELTNDSKFITASGAPVQSVNGKTGAVSLSAADVGARASDWMPTAANVGAVPTSRKVNGKALSADVTLSASDVGADKSGAAAAAVSEHNTDDDAHNDIRLLISGLAARLDALANSDDTTLDQMAEVVAYIKANRDLIEQITTGKVSVSDIVNNLTTNVSNKPLSAAQGVALKALIDAITVPTKLSELTNDKGYITGYTETDPTVPAWAKAASKPSYTSEEIAVDFSNVTDPIESIADGNLTSVLASIDGFITTLLVSVAGIPTKISQLTNDSNFITASGAPVQSVNGKTGAVSLSASDVNALASDSYTTKVLTVTYEDDTTENITLVVAK